MRPQFLGATDTVTGSRYLLGASRRCRSDRQAVILTRAHIDH